MKEYYLSKQNRHNGCLNTLTLSGLQTTAKYVYDIKRMICVLAGLLFLTLNGYLQALTPLIVTLNLVAIRWLGK